MPAIQKLQYVMLICDTYDVQYMTNKLIYSGGICVLQIEANVRVLTQERDGVNALYSEVTMNILMH